MSQLADQRIVNAIMNAATVINDGGVDVGPDEEQAVENAENWLYAEYERVSAMSGLIWTKCEICGLPIRLGEDATIVRCMRVACRMAAKA